MRLLISLTCGFALLAISTAQDLGVAGSYAVLGYATVTNTGTSIVNGNIGVSPGNSITGFPPGVLTGTIHLADADAQNAHAAASAAYTTAAGLGSTGTLTGDLGGRTLGPGVYTYGSDTELTGILTLDGQADPNSVWVFQIGSTLTTASYSEVLLVNGARACNVFWQVGSSATLGTYSALQGNVVALASITVTTGVTSNGGLYALNGAVTLDTNTVSALGTCSVVATTTAATTTDTTSATTSDIGTTTDSTSDTASDTGTATTTDTGTTTDSTSATTTDTGTATTTDTGTATTTDTGTTTDTTSATTTDTGTTTSPTTIVTTDTSTDTIDTGMYPHPNS
jgi:hypothetical protein